jgi:hypothetical protein
VCILLLAILQFQNELVQLVVVVAS